MLAVGNGKVLENGTKVALDVKVGDKILFGKYSGTEIKIDGEEVLILREDEVLAVLASVPTKAVETTCRSRSRTVTTRARRSCAASTAWPTPSA